MSQKLFTTMSILLFIILLIIALWGLTIYYTGMPERSSQFGTVIMDEFEPYHRLGTLPFRLLTPGFSFAIVDKIQAFI